jgi:hypothetical protein
VDPTLVGLGPEDEMVIASLAKKVSYLTSATWTTSNAVDDILFSSRVNPSQFDTDNLTNSKIYMTPMCWVNSLFDNWRGDLIFKFKVVASQFHKGRLRISFDPSGYSAENLITDPVSSNVIFTSILDLGDSNEVEFVVPYQQAISYLANRVFSTSNINWSTSLSPSFNYSNLFDNGTITLRVQTALTAPVASSSVAIMVFVRAADNFEVANPVEAPRLTMWAPQSDEWVVQADVSPAQRSETLGTMQAKRCAEQNLINFGETVKSLRQLLRRHSLVGATTPGADSTHLFYLWRRQFSKIPPMYGFDTSGINTAKGLVVSGSTFPFNYTQVTPLTWILPAFVAYRGSTNWVYNVTGNAAPVEHIRVLRYNIGEAASETVSAGSGGSTSSNASYYFNNFYTGATGQALTNQRTNAGLSVATPMYTPYRFQSTTPTNYTNPVAADGSIRDMFTLEAMFSGVGSPNPTTATIWTYNAIGTDFGMHFFLNVPTFWIYSGVPTPV